MDLSLRGTTDRSGPMDAHPVACDDDLGDDVQ